MIRPLFSPQLSSAKPRCGLQKISELLPRLIEQYELQAAWKKEMDSAQIDLDEQHSDRPDRQCTFNW